MPVNQKSLKPAMKPSPEPDGHVHVMPMGGPEHKESKDCWCEPELRYDFTDNGGHQVWVHKEIQ